jgi:ubiquitin-protein ligase
MHPGSLAEMANRRTAPIARPHPYLPRQECSPISRRAKVNQSSADADDVSIEPFGGTSTPYGTVATSIASSRLLKEIDQLKRHPLTGCTAAPHEDNILQWTAAIEGPPSTVYEGGTFFVELQFTDEYPFVAPKIAFLTRIYHCNINSQGKVCMDRTSSSWKSTMTISTVLESLISLLYACNPEDALVTSIAEQYMKEPAEYEKMARIWTERYAR